MEVAWAYTQIKLETQRMRRQIKIWNAVVRSDMLDWLSNRTRLNNGQVKYNTQSQPHKGPQDFIYKDRIWRS